MFPTALIAEDEPLLAQALKTELIKAWPGLQVLAIVGDGESAVREALARAPDVLFFDIRMPGMSGLDAAAELTDAWDASSSKPFPALAFVTAYDQYAMQAFDTLAVDYVLKPVQPERLARSVRKLQQAVTAARLASTPDANRLDVTTGQLRQLLGLLGTQTQTAHAVPLRQLQVGTPGNVIRMVQLDEVLYLQAADKYVRVVTADGEHLLRTPFKELLPRLDEQLFWQIHRATVVRAQTIESASRDEAGRLSVLLRGTGERLNVSRLYAYRFKAM